MKKALSFILVTVLMFTFVFSASGAFVEVYDSPEAAEMRSQFVPSSFLGEADYQVSSYPVQQ